MLLGRRIPEENGSTSMTFDGYFTALLIMPQISHLFSRAVSIVGPLYDSNAFCINRPPSARGRIPLGVDDHSCAYPPRAASRDSSYPALRCFFLPPPTAAQSGS